MDVYTDPDLVGAFVAGDAAGHLAVVPDVPEGWAMRKPYACPPRLRRAGRLVRVDLSPEQRERLGIPG